MASERASEPASESDSDDELSTFGDEPDLKKALFDKLKAISSEAGTTNSCCSLPQQLAAKPSESPGLSVLCFAFPRVLASNRQRA